MRVRRGSSARSGLAWGLVVYVLVVQKVILMRLAARPSAFSGTTGTTAAQQTTTGRHLATEVKRKTHLATVSCEAVKTLTSLFGILSADKGARACFGFRKVALGGGPFGSMSVCYRIFLPGPKRARKFSTRAENATHAGTLQMLGRVRISIEFDRRQRKWFVGIYR